MASGCPNHRQIRLLARALALRRRVWVFWPEEGLVECVTPERLGSYRRHWLVINFYRFVAEPVLRVAAGPRRLSYALRDMPPREMPGWIRQADWAHAVGLTAAAADAPADQASAGGSTRRTARRWFVTRSVWERCARLARPRKPSRFRRSPRLPDRQQPIRGCGVYLRTDFWAPIVSGGSYGHTCYVAKELAAVTESFVCFMANPFPMLDEFGLRQIVMPRPSATNNEDDIAAATPYYLNLLAPGVRRAAARVHLRAPVYRELGGRAAQRGIRGAVHPRIQRV